MKKIIFGLALLGLSIAARAASEGGHGESHIPFKEIAIQAINLGILLIIIFFAVRKSTVAFFKARYNQYNEQAKKTAEAQAAAEQALADIKSRIQNLQTNESQAVTKAQAEAEILKNKIIQEARAQSEKIKADTQLIINVEVANAKKQIRDEIINSSIELAKNNIKSSAETISKKSEKGFLQEISKTKTQVSV